MRSAAARRGLVLTNPNRRSVVREFSFDGADQPIREPHPMLRRVKTIRYRLLLALIGAGLIPSILILWITNRITATALEDTEISKIRSVGTEVARRVSSSMEVAESSLEALRLNSTLTNSNTSVDEVVSEMRRQVGAYRRFSDITIYDPEGRMVGSTTEGSHPEPTDFTDWFARAKNTREMVVSHPHRIRGVDGLHIKVYIPVEVEGFDEPHVLKARIPFKKVWDRIEGSGLADRDEVVLLDKRGKILYNGNETDVLERFDQRLPNGFWAENPKGVYVDSAGIEKIYYASPIAAEQTKVGEAWILVTFVPQSEVTEVIRHSQLFQLLFGVATLLLASVLGVYLAKGLSEPIVRVSEAAQQVAHGNLRERLPETGSLEVRRLSTSFNMMVDEVREHRDKLSSLVERRTRKLRDSEMRLRKTSAMLLASYEATQEAVLVVDPNGYVVAANCHFGEFFGMESTSVVGEQIADLEDPIIKCFEDPEDFRAEWANLAHDPHAYVESEWNLLEPEPRNLSIYSAPVTDPDNVLCARLWMFRDITEQQRLQAGLQEAQKMEAVGRLAGGVAHDFNNLLTGIIGNLSLAQMGGGEDEGESPEELVLTAKRAGERAADLVKGLLGFSRRTHLKFRIADCNEVIADVKSLTRRTIDPRITIVTKPEPALWGAKVDPNQIEQVVINMVVNAKDAMDSGTITVSSRNAVLEQEDLSEQIVGAEAGEYIAITVEDDGSGMPPEVLEKIYEPFFTTKEQGKGTGLGLATSYGIIRQHGGWIDCVSKPGEGTKFTIYLPKAAETAAVELEVDGRDEVAADRGGSETILLVDDEKVVRNVAQSVLKHHGYQTLVAEDGIVALEAFEKGDQDIDLVLLDLTMPRLSGADTFKRIRAEYGDVPVIVCSGYTVNLDEFEAENGSRPNGFVQKPYDIAELASQVREVLNGACLPA